MIVSCARISAEVSCKARQEIARVFRFPRDFAPHLFLVDYHMLLIHTVNTFLETTLDINILKKIINGTFFLKIANYILFSIPLESPAATVC